MEKQFFTYFSAKNRKSSIVEEWMKANISFPLSSINDLL